MVNTTFASIKRRGAFFIFPVEGAALLSTTGKTLRGIWRESEVRCVLKYAQFNIKLFRMKHKRYRESSFSVSFLKLMLLCESFPTLKL